MANNIDKTSSGLVALDRDGESKQLSELTFPSEHQIVILDTEVQKATQRNIARIPMTFNIRYNDAAKDPPALILLINPQNMSFTRDKKVNAEFTRGGHVIEEWGDMQETIGVSGKIGGYYVLNPNHGFSGLNRYYRSKSPSFKNLMNLFMIYRNNGMIFEKTIKNPKNSSEDRLMKNSGLVKLATRIPKMVQNAKNRIAIVGDVFLNFDGVEYKGSFEDFSIEESADSPYTLSYKFTFIVQSKYEVDKRNVETYTQRDYEFSDLGKNTLSSGQRDSLKRIIEEGITVSQQAEANSRATLANKGSVYINPNHITTPQEVTRTNYIQRSTVDQVSHLQKTGLNTDAEDAFRINQDYVNMSSASFENINKGFNDSVVTHKSILLKNGKPDDSATLNKAAELATEGRRNLLDKKSKIKE